MPKIGLLAGGGRLPLILADEAASEGWEVVAFAVEGDADEEELSKRVERIHWLRPEQVGRLIDLLHKEGIKDAVMAGKFRKQRLYGELKPDERSLKIIRNLPDNTDDSLLGALADELQTEGITLHPTTFCLNGAFAGEGLITGSPVTDAQWKDIRFGWKIAKRIGRMDIGQTVVVKNSAVMAVEAIEGTDEAILRGGKLAGQGAVVVKVAKPQQDLRFDVPTIGPETVMSMEKVGAPLLAIEAGWTIFLDGEDVLERARRAGITVVGCKINDE